MAVMIRNSNKIDVAQLADETMRILKGYADEVADGTDAAALKAAGQCVKDIKAAAPVRTGKYRNGWKKKQTHAGRGQAGYTIYNEAPGMPHLLENGHAKAGGGRVAGRPHIAPAARKAAEGFTRAVEEAVRNAAG